MNKSLPLLRALAWAACVFPLLSPAQENTVSGGLGQVSKAATATPAPKVDASGGPVTLKLDWMPGKTYTQKLTLDQSSKMNMLGQEMEQKMKMNMDMSMQVSLLAGTPLKEVKTQYDRVAMEMDMMGQKMGFDSAAQGANPQPGNPFAIMGAMVGKPFTLTFDDKNELVDAKGMDGLLGEAGNNPVAAEMMKQFVGKDQIAQMMNLAMAQAFPKTPVKPGETWDVKIPMNLGQMGNVEVVGKYTYLGNAPKGGATCAVVSMDATVAMNLDVAAAAGEGKASPMAMKVTDGKQSGYLYWDTQANWLRAMDMDQTMTLNIQAPGGEGAMAVPTTQKTTIEVDIK